LTKKSQIQALDRTQPGLPLSEGKIGSRTHDYKRHGTSCLYAAFSILTGKVIGKMTNRTRSKEFLSFMKKVNRSTPKGKDLHVILDNHSAHKTAEVRAWLQNKPHIHFHFTPTSSSWLNAVEGWFAQLERRSLYRGVFSSVSELNDEIECYIEVHNRETAKPFKWTKDAKSILAAVQRAKYALPNKPHGPLAVLFVDCCRAEGIAARFVSGYQKGNLQSERRDLHTWPEVYLPGAGWRGFDPTHGEAVADAHVTIAAAAHSRDTMPVSGVFSCNGANSSLEYTVEIQVSEA